MAIQLDFSSAEQQRKRITIDQQKQIRQLYTDAAKEIAERANKAPRVPSDVLRQQYLYDLQDQVNERLQSIEKDLGSTIQSNMWAVASGVVRDNQKFLKTYGLPIVGSFSHVPDDTVRAVATGQLYSGNWSLSRALWGGTQKTQQDVQSIVAKGIAENKSAYDIAKDLEKYVDPNARKDWEWSKVYPGTAKVIDYNAQRLARTMVSHAYQQSFVRTTQKNPFVTKYRWDSSNSGRVCEICEERDGQLFDKDDLPLDHPNGMCTFVAVMEDSMEEIADRIADWVEGNPDPAMDEYVTDLYGNNWADIFNQTKNNNPDNLPAELLNVLGYKGAEEKTELAVVNVNPNYNDRTQPYKNYHWNCQRCTPTFELRKRGYNVQARAFDGTYPGILQVFKFNSRDYNNYVALADGSKYASAYERGTDHNPNRFGRGAKSAARTIVGAMTKWGDGSRAALSVVWKSSTSSHILNVENLNGVISLVDSQCGKIVSGQKAIETYMEATVASNSELIRLDHLSIRTENVQNIERVVKLNGDL